MFSAFAGLCSFIRSGDAPLWNWLVRNPYLQSWEKGHPPTSKCWCKLSYLLIGLSYNAAQKLKMKLLQRGIRQRHRILETPMMKYQFSWTYDENSALWDVLIDLFNMLSSNACHFYKNDRRRLRHRSKARIDDSYAIQLLRRWSSYKGRFYATLWISLNSDQIPSIVIIKHFLFLSDLSLLWCWSLCLLFLLASLGMFNTELSPVTLMYGIMIWKDQGLYLEW